MVTSRTLEHLVCFDTRFYPRGPFYLKKILYLNLIYNLSSRETQETPTELSMFDLDSIKNANFIRDRPLIFLLHGYTGYRDFAPNPSIRPAYFENGEYNIISLDYNPLVREPCYVHAVKNLPTVANCTAQLIDYIVEQNIIPFENIHVIGFSLGAQTSGKCNKIRQFKLQMVLLVIFRYDCKLSKVWEVKTNHGTGPS